MEKEIPYPDEDITNKEPDFDKELAEEIESQEENDAEDNFDDGFDEDLDSFGGDGADSGEIPLNKHNDLIKSLTNFDPFLKDLFNNWLGLMWDEEKKEFVKNPLINPIMNLNCAMWCLRFLKNYARNNNIITDISSNDYKDFNEDMISELWYNLGTRDDFGIKEEGDLIALCTELEHDAKLVLMGAGDGRYNKFLQTTISRQESVQLDGKQQEQQTQVVRPSTGNKLKRLILGT